MKAMKTAISALALLLLAGCGDRDESGANQASGGAGQGTGRPGGGGPGALAGIYESGSAERRDQLCIVRQGEGEPRFGLIVWGSDDHSCMGSGEAVHQGERLLLKMAGDSACEIEARIAGGTVTLPAAVPEGCSYYCGARARFAERTLTRTGDDSTKAKDLVGDPLCG